MTSSSVNIPRGECFCVEIFLSKEIDSTWKIETLAFHWFFFCNNVKKTYASLKQYCTNTVLKSTITKKKRHKKYSLICFTPFVSVAPDCYYTRPAFDNTRCSLSCSLNHFFIANPIIQFYNFHWLIESVKVIWKVDASDLPLPTVCWILQLKQANHT